MAEVVYRFTEGQQVSLCKDLVLNPSMTLRKGHRGIIVKIHHRRYGKHKHPYDVRWDGQTLLAPMAERELKAA
jgi:hypothetical protein